MAITAEEFLADPQSASAEDFLQGPTKTVDAEDFLASDSAEEFTATDSPPAEKPLKRSRIAAEGFSDPMLEADNTPERWQALQRGWTDPLLPRVPKITGEEARQAMRLGPVASQVAAAAGLPTELGPVGSKVAAGASRAAGSFVDFLSSPVGLAGIGASALSPLAARVVAGLFAADMARHQPEAAREFGKAVGAGDVEKGVETGLGLAANTVLPGLAGAHAIAGKVKAAPNEAVLEGNLEKAQQNAGNVEAPVSPEIEQALKEAEAGKSAEEFLSEPAGPRAEEFLAVDPDVARLREELAAVEDQPGKAEMKGAAASFERPTDVLDWMQKQGFRLRKLGREEASDLAEPWRRAQKETAEAFDVKGENPDVVAEAYRRATGKEISDEDFLKEVEGVKAARAAALEEHKLEFGKLSQDAAWQAEAMEGFRKDAGAKIETIEPQELAEGDRVKVGGHDGIVERVKVSPADETRVESVTIKFGARFGTRVLAGDAAMRIDAGSLERAFTEGNEGNKGAVEAWADRVIEEAKGRVSAGLDPELLAAYAVKGAAVIVRGVRDVGEWAAEMTRQFGDGIREHLPAIRKRAEELIAKGWQGADLPAGLKPGAGERAFAKQVDVSSDVSNEVRLQQGPRLYVKETFTDWAAAADGILKKEGLEGATRAFMEGGNVLPDHVREALGFAVVKKWGELEQMAALVGDAAKGKAAVDAQLAMYDALNRGGTDAGRALAAYRMFAEMTPAAKLADARRVIEGARQTRMGGMKPGLENIKETIAEVNGKAAVEVVNDPAVVRAGMELTEPMVEKVAKIAANQRILKLWDSIWKESKSWTELVAEAGIRAHEIAREHYAGTDLTHTLAEKLRAGLRIEMKPAERFARLFDKEFAAEVGRESVKLMKEARRALWAARQKQLLVMAEEYFTKNASGRTLVDKVAEILQVDAKAAEKFAKILEDRFARLATERKRAALHKLSLPARIGPVVAKGLHDKLIELSNLGALDDAAFDKVVGEKLGLPQWTREIAVEVKRLAEEVQKAPDGFQRMRKTMELLNYVERTKGMRWFDLPMSFWMANILSGPPTHAVNLMSTGMNTAAEIGFLVARDPLGFPGIMASAARGLRKGAREGGEVLRTGMVTGTRLTKVAAMRPLELVKFTGAASFLNAWKYNFRAMAAEDLLFFKSAEEAHSYAAARMIAKREGLSGDALERRVVEVLGHTEERRAAAFAQADMEGLRGSDRTRRVDEIMERSRPAEMVENAKDFALRSTFNEKPWGVLGALAGGMNWTLARVPAMRMVVPFVDIVANVTNESLNYFPPVGLSRAVWGSWKGELEGKVIRDRTELADQWAKALFSTAALTGIGVLAAKYLGSANPEFMINGAGPRTPEQRKQLHEAGWVPYSVKIGDRYYTYGWTPAAVGLAVLGNYLDAIRYKHLEKTDMLNRTAYAVKTSLSVITQQSFLKGIADFMEAMDRDASKHGGEGMMRSVATAASNFVVPNLVRQVDRIFDPTVYDAKTVEESLVASVPFARRLNKPSINVLGEPVKRYVSERFVSEARGDVVWRAIADKQAWVSVPERDTLLRGRPMTEEQYYRYVQQSGRAIRTRLLGEIGLIRASRPEKAREIVERIVTEERKRVKAGM